MTENKEVTGVICIPIPPLAKGKHTLSTTYTDTIYQTASKCFQIEVIDSEVTIDVGNINGRPNCTLNVSVNVTNDVDQPVEDGVIKVYYHNTQDSPQMQTFVNGLDSLLLGSAEVGSDGVAHVSFQVPSEVRGGKLILKTTYTHSDMGYEDKTFTSPLYINRGGYLTLDAYQTIDGVKSLVPVNGWVNEPNRVEVVATLYDDNDSAKVPLSGVPINIKMNDETITLDVEGSDEKSYTNSQGKVTVNSLATTANMNDFTLTAINEGKEYVNELRKQNVYRVRKRIGDMRTGGSTTNAQSREFSLFATLKDVNGNPASGAVGILKVEDVAYKEGDDPIGGNGNTKRFTESSTAGTYDMDIQLANLDAGTKNLTFQFGGDWDGSLYQQRIITTTLTLVKRTLSTTNATATWRNGGVSLDFKLTTLDGKYLQRNFQVSAKVNDLTMFSLHDSPTVQNTYTNATGNDFQIQMDKTGNCQIWLHPNHNNWTYNDGQTYTFKITLGGSNVYEDHEFTIDAVYHSS